MTLAASRLVGLAAASATLSPSSASSVAPPSRRRPRLRRRAALASRALQSAGAEGYVCEGPGQGCNAGLWNPNGCVCECIPPFSRDATGFCTVSSGGDKNPWEDCAEGTDCPWWIEVVDEGKEEECVTGNEVPAGIWDIYPTEQICCQSNPNHLYTDKCQPVTASPTEAPEHDDEFQVVPLKFSIGGLPTTVDVIDMKDEMILILKRILINLSERMSSLKIKFVEEDLVSSGEASDAEVEGKRVVYYDITVVRQEGKDFGPIIIQWIKDSYFEIVERIQNWSNARYPNANVNMNWCTSKDGAFQVCTDEVVPVTVRFDLRDNQVQMDQLVMHLVGRYKDMLSRVADLDVTLIKVRDIVTSSDGIVEVNFDVHVSGTELGPIVRQTIADGNDAVLAEIQSFTDNTHTQEDLEWCMVESTFTVCESQSGVPIWVVALLVILGLILCCIAAVLVMRRIRRRDEEKNALNMMNFIDTGKQKGRGLPQRTPGDRLARRPSKQLRRSPEPPRRKSHRDPPELQGEKRRRGSERAKHKSHKSKRKSHKKRRHSERDDRPRRKSHKSDRRRHSEHQRRKSSGTLQTRKSLGTLQNIERSERSDDSSKSIEKVALALTAFAHSTEAGKTNGPQSTRLLIANNPLENSRPQDRWKPTRSSKNDGRRHSYIDPGGQQGEVPTKSGRRRQSYIDAGGKHGCNMGVNEVNGKVIPNNPHTSDRRRHSYMDPGGQHKSMLIKQESARIIRNDPHSRSDR
ncbi:hypothetical protein ACHAWF_013445 [Thalassiosira exigua]